MVTTLVSPAAALDFAPGPRGKLHDDFVRFPAKDHVAVQLAESRSRRRGGMRTDRNLYCTSIQPGEPLPRNAQLGWRTPPEEVRRRRRNHQEVRIELVELSLHILNAETVQLSINQPWLMPTLFDLVERK